MNKIKLLDSMNDKEGKTFNLYAISKKGFHTEYLNVSFDHALAFPYIVTMINMSTPLISTTGAELLFYLQNYQLSKVINHK